MDIYGQSWLLVSSSSYFGILDADFVRHYIFSIHSDISERLLLGTCAFHKRQLATRFNNLIIDSSRSPWFYSPHSSYDARWKIPESKSNTCFMRASVTLNRILPTAGRGPALPARISCTRQDAGAFVCFRLYPGLNRSHLFPHAFIFRVAIQRQRFPVSQRPKTNAIGCATSIAARRVGMGRLRFS